MAAADSALAGAGVEGAPPSQAKPGPAPSAPAPSSSDTCAYFEPAIGPAGDAAALRRLFSAWGGVARVDLPRYLHSSQVKGYAFLHFEKAGDMEAACRAFEGGMPSTCPALPLPRQQEWREVEQSVQEGALPALRLIPRATWAQYKAVWSSTQARARTEAVGQPPIHRCLVRVFGLPATGVRYAELRQRLAELAPVAYLDFPHACAKVKKRCIGGVPCQRCERLGIECVLRKPKKRQRDQGPDEAASSSITQQAGATAPAAEEHVSKAARTAAHQAAPGAFANQLQRHHPAIGPEQGVTEVAGAVQVTSPQDPQSKQAAATHPFAPLVRDVHDKPETLAGLEGEDGEEVMALQSALAASPAAQQLAAFEPMYGFPTATFANLALEAFLRWTPGDKATIGMPASGAVMWAMPGVALQQALLMRGMVEAGLPRLRWESTVLRTVYEHADSFVNPLKSEFEAVNVTYDAHMRVWPFRGGRTLHMSVLDSSFCGTLTQQQKERAMVFTRELSNAFEACCDEVLQTGPGASAGAAPRGAFATEVARTASSMSTHDDASAGGTGAESSSAGSSATQPAAISFEGRSCAGEGGRVISVRFPRPSRDMMFLVHMAFLWNWVLSGTPCSVAATLRAAKVAVAEPGDATPPLPLPTLQCPMPSQVAHQYSHILHGMQVLRAVQEGRSHDARAAFPHFAAAGIHARLDASGVVRVSVDPTGTVGLRTLTPAANAARSMASLYESIFT